MTTCLDDAQLCSLISKSSGESPVGSASYYQALLVLELPAPWPRNALGASHLAPDVQEVIADFGRSEVPCSVLAVQPDSVYSRPGEVRALYFRRPEEMFAEFERLEFVVPKTQLAGLLDAIALLYKVTTFLRRYHRLK